VLVMHDLLGLFDEFRPKFVKRFGELRKPWGCGRCVRRRGARRVVPGEGALLLMERIRTPAAMRAWADARRAEGARIGLVPTMGTCTKAM